MATQTDLDRLNIAWAKLQRAVNSTIPARVDQIWAARNRMIPPGTNPGPKPS